MIGDLENPVETLAEYRNSGKYATADVLAHGGAHDPTTNTAAINFAAVNVMQDIGDEAGAELFLESFNRLPDRAQAQTFAALLSHADDPPEATPAEIQTFLAEDDAGETMLAEWGEDAAFHLGVVRARTAKIFAGLSEGERREVEHFITSSSQDEWTALLRMLSNPAAVQTRPEFRKLTGAA